MTDSDGWVKTSTVEVKNLPKIGMPCEVKFSVNGDIVEAGILGYKRDAMGNRQPVWVIVGQPDFYRIVSNG